jgi:excisionase family DNA binding protein
MSGGRTTKTPNGIAHLAPGAGSAETAVPELMTTREVARMLSAGERSVWRWSRSGAMPAPLKLNPGRQGAVRFRRSEILAWIEAGCPRVDER